MVIRRSRASCRQLANYESLQRGRVTQVLPTRCQRQLIAVPVTLLDTSGGPLALAPFPCHVQDGT